MARRGKKLAKQLRGRILAWEQIQDKGAFRKPGGKPGDYQKRYEGGK